MRTKKSSMISGAGDDDDQPMDFDQNQKKGS